MNFGIITSQKILQNYSLQEKTKLQSIQMQTVNCLIVKTHFTAFLTGEDTTATYNSGILKSKLSHCCVCVTISNVLVIKVMPSFYMVY